MRGPGSSLGRGSAGQRELAGAAAFRANRWWEWVGALLGLAVAGGLQGEAPAGYYEAAEGLSGGALQQALHEIVDGHTVIPYEEAFAPLREIWKDPAQPDHVILAYSLTSVPAFGSWNREHLWPRSRGNSEQAGPDDSDLFNLVPTEIAVNAERGSLYFDVSTLADPLYRIPAHSLAPQTSRDSDSWQPAPAERGDIARALFYLAVRYDGEEPETSDFELVNLVPQGAQMGRLNTLLIWHAEDPPDEAERARNDTIFSQYQHNRNPFIDRPEFATAIWGSGVPGDPAGLPFARVSLLNSTAAESPATAARFLVSLNQFAGAEGLTVAFALGGDAQSDEFALSGAGVSYDSATGTGTIFLPAYISNAQILLTAVADGVTEPAETAVLTLQAGPGYTFSPDASASGVATILDSPRLPAQWNFDTIPFPNPIPANSGVATLSTSNWRGTVTNFSGISGSALALVGNAGNGSWIDLQFSMTGFRDLQLSFSTRGTSTGFTQGQWSWSTDGVLFTQAGGNTATTSTSFVSRSVSFAGIAQMTHAPEVTLRYTLSGATGSAGNNRIDNLALSATPLATGAGPRQVSVQALTPALSESLGLPGLVSVDLDGLAPAGGLAVDFSVSGSALAGTDYTLTGVASFDPATGTGTLFFPADSTAQLLAVTPMADLLTEGTETVTLNLHSAGDGRYLLTSSSTASVRIHELENDAFAEATVLEETPARILGNNSDASREPEEPAHFSSGIVGGHSLWYRWTPPMSGYAIFTTAGSSFDTVLSIYTGTALSALTRLGSDDDSAGNLASRVILPVAAGTSYLIAVDGYGSSTGDFVLEVSFSESPPVLPKPVVSLFGGVALAEDAPAGTYVYLMLDQTAGENLVVGLRLSGTATAGADYRTSPASIDGLIPLTIPAGSIFALVDIFPQTDSELTEFTETVTFTVEPGTGFLLSPTAAMRTLSLADDTPYGESWGRRYPGLTGAASFPNADPDNDGWSNLAEFALDRNPLSPEKTSGLRLVSVLATDPADGLSKPYPLLIYRRRADAHWIPISLEKSASPLFPTWDTEGLPHLIEAVPGTDLEEVFTLGAEPFSPTPQFFRLRVSPP